MSVVINFVYIFERTFDLFIAVDGDQQLHIAVCFLTHVHLRVIQSILKDLI